MHVISPFAAVEPYRHATLLTARGCRLAADFSDLPAEYRAARESAALFDRTDRVWLHLTGNDRAAWLHNLITNDVKSLTPGQGCYAFSLDVRGRIQFDLHVHARPDALWLDLDRADLPTALAHLEHYHLMENIELTDHAEDTARLACIGPKTPYIAADLGVPNLLSIAPHATVNLDDHTQLIRHDLGKLPGFELSLSPIAAVAWWQRLADAGAAPAGRGALDILRIEAGIPWPGHELDGRALAAETGLVENAVSYTKGCYLGHEVVERLRSRGVLARRLLRVWIEDGAGIELPAPLTDNGVNVGRVTSLVDHPSEPGWIGLGYVSTRITPPTQLRIPAGPAARIDEIR